MKYLIEKGANVNAKNNGTTPLHAAVFSNFIGAVRYLIEKGAEIDVKNKDGKIPFDIADSGEKKMKFRCHRH